MTPYHGGITNGLFQNNGKLKLLIIVGARPDLHFGEIYEYTRASAREELLDALEGKEHHCGFDGVETVLKANGRYCAAPVTHRATLGRIADLLRTFHDQPRTLVMPEIPAGSFTELLKTEKCGQVSVNISRPGITKDQHWHNSKWEFFIVVSGHALIQERKIGTARCWNSRCPARRSRQSICCRGTRTTSSTCPKRRTW